MFKPSKNHPAITTITDPAEYHNYGPEVERGDPARVLSRSQLWEMSPALRKWKRGIERKATKSMDFGTLVDCLALTPGFFDDRFAVCPETYGDGKPWNWNANECKAFRAEAEAAGKLCVKSAEVAEAQAAASAYEIPRLKEFLSVSKTQVMVIADWHDEAGIIVPVRCMVDLMPDPTSEFGDTLADLKTTKSAESREWSRQVFYNGYHFQAALYLDVVNAATGLKYQQFEHHIIENSAPYEATWRALSSEFLTVGRVHYESTLRAYCKALTTGKWPGYDKATVEPEAWMI